MKTVRTELKEYWICDDCGFETDHEWSYTFHIEGHGFPSKYKEIYIENSVDDSFQTLIFYRFDSEDEFNLFSEGSDCKDFSRAVENAKFDGVGWYQFRTSDYGGYCMLRKASSAIKFLKAEVEGLTSAISEIEEL